MAFPRQEFTSLHLDPLLEPFDSLVSRHPEQVALATPRDRCTFAELDALARRIEPSLRESWIRPSQAIGLRAPNGPGFLAAWIAARRAGLALLLMDSGTPFAERMRNAEGVGVGAILTCGKCWPGAELEFEYEHIQVLEPFPLLETRASIIKLSSGSSGRPRGVEVSSEALLADDGQLRTAMGILDSDILLSAIPFSHSYGLASLVMPCLTRGIRLALPDNEQPFAPLEAAQTLGATVFPTVPAYVGGLARIGEHIELPPSIRLFISAGALLAPDIAARFREIYGQPIHTFYGSSESGGICYDAEGGAAERGTVGTAIDGVQVELDPDAAFGAPARVIVRSASVATRYVPGADNHLSGGRFISDDLAVWKDGELSIVGRAGHFINVKGNKVNPREVEAVLRQLDSVDDVYVMGLADAEHKGEIVRAVVASRSGAVRADDVLAWCRRRLSAFKIPRSVVMVREIPRTERGKVDHDALSRLKTDRLPRADSDAGDHG